jgi:hypothetical protein
MQNWEHTERTAEQINRILKDYSDTLFFVQDKNFKHFKISLVILTVVTKQMDPEGMYI